MTILDWLDLAGFSSRDSINIQWFYNRIPLLSHGRPIVAYFFKREAKKKTSAKPFFQSKLIKNRKYACGDPTDILKMKKYIKMSTQEGLFSMCGNILQTHSG